MTSSPLIQHLSILLRTSPVILSLGIIPFHSAHGGIIQLYIVYPGIESLPNPSPLPITPRATIQGPTEISQDDGTEKTITPPTSVTRAHGAMPVSERA